MPSTRWYASPRPGFGDDRQIPDSVMQTPDALPDDAPALPPLRFPATRPYRARLLALGLIAFLFAALAAPSSAATGAGAGRPKIGLVLGGGGARGAAHIGVLRVLERERIPVDYVAGTSMGAIVGGLYASGLSADEIERVLNDIDWTEAFDDKSPRVDRPFVRKRDDDNYLVKRDLGLGDDLQVKFPAGLIGGQKIDLILKANTLHVSRIDDFDRLPTPFRAIATDILTGQAVVLSHGDLARSIRASMSVPALFAPVEIDGKLLVDGGVANNVPVDVVRQMGADIVIAVDVGSPALTREQLNSVFGITNQLTWILTARNTEIQIASLKKTDTFIQPKLGEFSSASFDKAGTVIPLGEEAAQGKTAQLRQRGVAADAYRAYLADRASRREKSPVVEFVRVENDSPLADGVIEARLTQRAGEPLDPKTMDQDIALVYGLGNFESVRYAVVNEDGRTGVVVKAKEKSWGPNFIQAGIQLSQTDNGDSSFNVGGQIRRPAINALNGEVRLALQIGADPAISVGLYQPLDEQGHWFVAPRLFAGGTDYNLFADGSRIAEYRVRSFGGEVAGGYNFDVWGELSAGLRWYTGDAELRTGSPLLPDYDFDAGEAFLRFTVDTLDDINFPRNGTYSGVGWLSSQQGLGADTTFDQVDAGINYAKSWDRDTINAVARVGWTVSGDVPIQSLYQLGGPFRLSGLDNNALSGQYLGFGRLTYFRRVNDFQLMPAYLGASLEAGNAWLDRSDVGFDDLVYGGNLFFGVDTPIGPLYLGGGYSHGGPGDGGQFAGFLLLGRALRY
jgi:NTE family protein